MEGRKATKTKTQNGQKKNSENFMKKAPTDGETEENNGQSDNNISDKPYGFFCMLKLLYFYGIN